MNSNSTFSTSCFPVSIPQVHSHSVQVKPPSRTNSVSSELYTKSKAFLQDTFVSSNASSMKSQSPQTINGDSSSKNCHFFHAFSRCFNFCSKPKEYSDGHKQGAEMEENCSFEMSDPSEILSVNEVNLLGQTLPPIAIGNSWKLTFSTTKDGFCLGSLYRRMSSCSHDSPILLVIQDTKNRVFGVLASNSLIISERFYGSSQSFLYQFSPSFQVYKWNGDNFYFIKGNADSLIFGSGNGKFGLWLDGDLNKGRTQSCQTFRSPPLVPEEDFIVKSIECWTFEKLLKSKKAKVCDFDEDHFWMRSFASDKILSMDKKDLNELETERKTSLTSKSKAEQEIVNQFVIKMTDELRSALQCQGSGEFRPELIIGRSEILDIDDVVNIQTNIMEQCPWFLTFSTLLNGNSLETLYNKTATISGPTLLLIKDHQKRVFGVLLSDPPRLSTGYYGTGQSFLFRCRPDFHVDRWTGKDHYFVLGSSDALTIGGVNESGQCALRLNSTLTEGKTGECLTYGNQPLVPECNFKIKIMECWHFGLPSNAV